MTRVSIAQARDVDDRRTPVLQSVLCSVKQGEKLMPVGMFRSEEGWVQVDYGTGNIPIPRSKYDENRYKPDFDKLPSEAEYWAAEKKKEDDAPRS